MWVSLVNPEFLVRVFLFSFFSFALTWERAQARSTPAGEAEAGNAEELPVKAYPVWKLIHTMGQGASVVIGASIVLDRFPPCLLKTCSKEVPQSGSLFVGIEHPFSGLAWVVSRQA